MGFALFFVNPKNSPDPFFVPNAELVVGNMCRRVLHIIREEAVAHAAGSGALGTGTGGVAQMETGAVTGGGGENDQQTRMKRFKQVRKGLSHLPHSAD